MELRWPAKMTMGTKRMWDRQGERESWVGTWVTKTDGLRLALICLSHAPSLLCLLISS